MEPDLFICACHSHCHQFIMNYGEWEHEDETTLEKTTYREVYMSPHLIKRSFFYRLWYGIKYIFGFKSNYGAWDEIILKPEDVDKLQKVVDYLRKV